jgi:hypothetical protein
VASRVPRCVGHADELLELQRRVSGSSLDEHFPSTCPVVPGSDVSLLVDDEQQGVGLRTLMLENLIARSVDRGYSTMTTPLVSTDSQMRHVLEDLGLPVQYICNGTSAAR